MKPICPKCKNNQVFPIVYGFAKSELIYDEDGCLCASVEPGIEGVNPGWLCRNCGNKFGKKIKKSLSGSDALMAKEILMDEDAIAISISVGTGSFEDEIAERIYCKECFQKSGIEFNPRADFMTEGITFCSNRAAKGTDLSGLKMICFQCRKIILRI